MARSLLHKNVTGHTVSFPPGSGGPSPLFEVAAHGESWTRRTLAGADYSTSRGSREKDITRKASAYSSPVPWVSATRRALSLTRKRVLSGFVI